MSLGADLPCTLDVHDGFFACFSSLTGRLCLVLATLIHRASSAKLNLEIERQLTKDRAKGPDPRAKNSTSPCGKDLQNSCRDRGARRRLEPSTAQQLLLLQCTWVGGRRSLAPRCKVSRKKSKQRIFLHNPLSALRESVSRATRNRASRGAYINHSMTATIGYMIPTAPNSARPRVS